MTEKFQAEAPVAHDLSLDELQALIRKGRREQSKAVHAQMRALFGALRSFARAAPKRRRARDHGVPARA